MSNCSICNNTLGEKETICSRCGYSLNSTYEEKIEFLGMVESKRKKLKKAESKVDNAGYLLYVLA